jgi:iron complex outermembrane recepter protein
MGIRVVLFFFKTNCPATRTQLRKSLIFNFLKQKKVRRYAVLLALGVPFGAQAQHCHTPLLGHVTDSDDGLPLADARVRVLELDQATSTDAQGHFAFADLCVDSVYTLAIEHVGCTQHTQRVRVSDNLCLDIALQHVAHLAEVLVVERAIAAAPIQANATVSGTTLEATRGLGLGETVRQLPGVTTLNSGTTVAKPVIQGLHSNRIALVNQGVVLESQQWGADHAPEIDPFAAEQVTVVKGAAGVRYGVGAMGGAIVLEPAPLRRQVGVGGWASVGGWSNGRSGVVAAAVDWRPARHAEWAMRLQGTAKRSGNLRAPDYWLGNTGSAELNFSGMVERQGRRWTHTLSAARFGQRIGVLRAAHTGNLDDLLLSVASDTPRNNLDFFTYSIDRPRQEVVHNTLKYKGLYQMNDTWRWVTQFGAQYNVREEYDRTRRNSTAAERAQVRFQLWTHTLDASLEHRPLAHWEGAAGVQVQQQLNYVSRGGFVPDYLGWGASVWALERWRRYTSRWEWELGGRYDYRWQHATTRGNGSRNLDRRIQFGNASGVVGGLWRVHPTLTLALHTGLAWRPPSVNELFARGVHHGAGTFEQGDSTLTSEKAWNSNGTLRYRHPRSGLQAEVMLYRNAIRDFIFLEPQNVGVVTVRGVFPAYRYRQSDAVLRGLDASASVPLAAGWSAESRLSVLRGTRQLPENQRDWLPLMPADRWQYGLRWQTRSTPTAHAESDMGGTSVQVLATTVWRQSRIPQEGLLRAAPPTVTTLGVEATHVFWKKKRPLEVGLSVRNLTNARYREYLNFFRFFADEPGLNVGLRVCVRV